MKHCPFCHTDYKEKRDSCPNCGASEAHVKCEACGKVHNEAHCPGCGFGATEVLRTCPVCGRRSKYAHCPDCGTRLAGEASRRVYADPIPPALRSRKGAAIAVCVFIILGLCLVLGPILLRSGSSPQPRPAVTATATQIQQNEGGFGDGTYLKIVSARRGTDSYGNEAVFVAFEWTNQPIWERRVMTGVIPNVYQNGVKLDSTIPRPDDDEGNFEYYTVQPGATHTITMVWKLLSGDDPVLVECVGGFDRYTVVRLFEQLEERE